MIDWCLTQHKQYFSYILTSIKYKVHKMQPMIIKDSNAKHTKLLLINSREASDAGEFHLKTKSRDFRVIFYEK